MTTKSVSEMNAEILRLTAENEALKAKKNVKLSVKVSAKGGVSVYGLGRFPVTLYGAQWERLAEVMPEIKAFLQANKSLLAVKGATTPAPVKA